MQASEKRERCAIEDDAYPPSLYLLIGLDRYAWEPTNGGLGRVSLLEGFLILRGFVHGVSETASGETAGSGCETVLEVPLRSAPTALEGGAVHGVGFATYRSRDNSSKIPKYNTTPHNGVLHACQCASCAGDG